MSSPTQKGLPALDFESKWTGPDELELTVTERDGMSHTTKVLYLTASQAGSLADLLNAEVQLQTMDLLNEPAYYGSLAPDYNAGEFMEKWDAMIDNLKAAP